MKVNIDEVNDVVIDVIDIVREQDQTKCFMDFIETVTQRLADYDIYLDGEDIYDIYNRRFAEDLGETP